MNIHFRAEGQSLIRVDSENVAANSKGFLFAKFDVGEDWNGLTLKAVFEQKRNSWSRILVDGICLVPTEVLSPGNFKVWLEGIDSTKAVRATTHSVKVDVLDGPPSDNKNASAPTASEIEQLITIASKVRQDADNGVFNAKISGVTAESVAETEEASVENKGTPFDAALHFKIPQGKRGEKGDRGAPGESFYAFFSTDEIDAYIAEKKPTSFNALWLGSDVGKLVYGTVYNITVSYDDNGNATGFIYAVQGSLIATGPEGPAGETSCICSYVAEINNKLEGYTSDYLSFLWAGVDNTKYNYISAASHTETSLTLMKGDLYRLRIVGSEMIPRKLGNFQGEAGKSAYDIYVEQGGTLSENEWLESLKGSSVSITKLEESDESGGDNNVEFSDGKKLTVKNGKDGLDAEMYSHKLYKVYSLADIEKLCASRAITIFYIVNCGEAFSHTDSGGYCTAINTGDIFRVSANNGTLWGLMRLDNGIIGSEEGTLIEWYESDGEGGYKRRYTPVLNGSSKSGKYELIRKITTTAEDVVNGVGAYKIEADEKSNPFNLRELICFCWFPEDTEKKNLLFQVNGKTLIKRTDAISTAKSYLRIEAALRGYWVAESMQTTSASGVATAQKSFLRNEVTDNVSSITLSADGDVFPEGTIIEIYGVIV